MLSRLATTAYRSIISSPPSFSAPAPRFLFQGRRLLLFGPPWSARLCFVFHSHSWLYRILSNHHAHRHTLITGTKDTAIPIIITFLLLPFDPCLGLHPSLTNTHSHHHTHRSTSRQNLLKALAKFCPAAWTLRPCSSR